MSVASSTISTDGGGSSSVFSSACAASICRSSATSTTKMRRRAENGASAATRSRRRTWQMRMRVERSFAWSCPLSSQTPPIAMRSMSGASPASTCRQARQAPHGAGSPAGPSTGSAQLSVCASRRASVALPTPGGPANR